METTLLVAIGVLVLNTGTVVAGAVWAVGRVRSLAELTEEKVESSTKLLAERISDLARVIERLSERTDKTLEDHEKRLRVIEERRA